MAQGDTRLMWIAWGILPANGVIASQPRPQDVAGVAIPAHLLGLLRRPAASSE